MLEITDAEVKKRLAFDNSWWEEGANIDARFREMPKRSYFETFCQMAFDRNLRRAVVLMGPRRVGKTVMLHQTIQRLLEEGAAPRSILYVSLDTPTYSGLGLDRLLALFRDMCGWQGSDPASVFFDEIQYLRYWERHLKSLVDSYPAIKIVASGSAAAALRLKSDESGAGRFTDFRLPPLSFAEFLTFRNYPAPKEPVDEDIAALNTEFLNYLNFGGFPEAIFSETVRESLQRHIGADIIDKVLLRDLPSLYGIQDTQELNRLFATLAYNTGNEVSLIELSRSSGVAKNTLTRYLTYLEAAFLIRRLYRIDENARHFRRATHFKVYLTNPSLRAALFGPIAADDEAMGRLAETALVSQLHQDVELRQLYYSRWSIGEVDLVILDRATQAPAAAIEVKWSDRMLERPSELAPLAEFARRHSSLKIVSCCTRSVSGQLSLGDQTIDLDPTSLLCLGLGRTTTGRSVSKRLRQMVESA